MCRPYESLAEAQNNTKQHIIAQNSVNVCHVVPELCGVPRSHVVPELCGVPRRPATALGHIKGMQAPPYMGQETRYQEILLVFAVGVLASWNYTLTVDNFVLPHKVAMYSVKPVLQNDRHLGGFDVVNSAAKTKRFHDVVFDASYVPVARSGDFDFHYLSAIQISKYILGCYGNHSMGDEVRLYCIAAPCITAQCSSNTTHAQGMDSWKKNVVDIWPAHTAGAKANGTRILDRWQVPCVSMRGMRGV